MKRLVIANRGCANIGKSSAIKMVYEVLKEKYCCEKVINQGGDLAAIFLIDGHKVGIESQGDPGSDMEDTIDYFIDEGCEIIVTACRTKGSTFTKVRDYLGEELCFDIIWSAHDVLYLDELDQSVYNNLNRNYGKRVLGIIEGRIGGKI